MCSRILRCSFLLCIKLLELNLDLWGNAWQEYISTSDLQGLSLVYALYAQIIEKRSLQIETNEMASWTWDLTESGSFQEFVSANVLPKEEELMWHLSERPTKGIWQPSLFFMFEINLLMQIYVVSKILEIAEILKAQKDLMPSMSSQLWLQWSQIEGLPILLYAYWDLMAKRSRQFKIPYSFVLQHKSVGISEASQLTGFRNRPRGFLFCACTEDKPGITCIIYF